MGPSRLVGGDQEGREFQAKEKTGTKVWVSDGGTVVRKSDSR